MDNKLIVIINIVIQSDKQYSQKYKYKELINLYANDLPNRLTKV